MSSPLELLRSVFGYPTFRGLQQEIVEHVVAAGDAIALMPARGGKSICHAVPALPPDVGGRPAYRRARPQHPAASAACFRYQPLGAGMLFPLSSRLNQHLHRGFFQERSWPRTSPHPASNPRRRRLPEPVPSHPASPRRPSPSAQPPPSTSLPTLTRRARPRRRFRRLRAPQRRNPSRRLPRRRSRHPGEPRTGKTRRGDSRGGETGTCGPRTGKARRGRRGLPRRSRLLRARRRRDPPSRRSGKLPPGPPSRRPRRRRPKLQRRQPKLQRASQAAAGTEAVARPAPPSTEERQRWIATIAYYRAEARAFAPGYEVQDWLDAEAEIDALISKL